MKSIQDSTRYKEKMLMYIVFLKTLCEFCGLSGRCNVSYTHMYFKRLQTKSIVSTESLRIKMIIIFNLSVSFPFLHSAHVGTRRTLVGTYYRSVKERESAG